MQSINALKTESMENFLVYVVYTLILFIYIHIVQQSLNE